MREFYLRKSAVSEIANIPPDGCPKLCNSWRITKIKLCNIWRITKIKISSLQAYPPTNSYSAASLFDVASMGFR